MSLPAGSLFHHGQPITYTSTIAAVVITTADNVMIYALVKEFFNRFFNVSKIHLTPLLDPSQVSNFVPKGIFGSYFHADIENGTQLNVNN